MARKSAAQKAAEAAEAAARNVPAGDTSFEPAPAGAEHETQEEGVDLGRRPARTRLPRQEALSEVEQLDANRKGLGDGLGQEGGKGTPPPEQPQVFEPEPKVKRGRQPEPEAQPQAQPAAPQGTPQQPPAGNEVETRRLMVDDVEYEVPVSEINARGGEANWQMWRAGKNRLDEAKAARDAAVNMKAEMAEWIARNLKPPAAAPGQPPNTQQEQADQLEQYIDAIRYGTPEESAQALREAMRMSRPEVNPNLMLNQAIVQINRTNAQQAFMRKYADIVQNPMLFTLAKSLESDRVSKFPREFLYYPGARMFDWGRFYDTIGTQVRSAVQRPSQPAPAPPTPSQASQSVTTDREARKASIESNPSSAGARAQPPAGDDKPESRDDTLNQMRRRRGIPTE